MRSAFIEKKKLGGSKILFNFFFAVEFFIFFSMFVPDATNLTKRGIINQRQIPNQRRRKEKVGQLGQEVKSIFKDF